MRERHESCFLIRRDFSGIHYYCSNRKRNWNGGEKNIYCLLDESPECVRAIRIFMTRNNTKYLLSLTLKIDGLSVLRLAAYVVNRRVCVNFSSHTLYKIRDCRQSTDARGEQLYSTCAHILCLSQRAQLYTHLRILLYIPALPNILYPSTHWLWMQCVYV